MKKLLLFGALAFGLNAFGQVEAGVYSNQAGQILKIQNLRECCFDYEVEWGVNDKYGCKFSAMGTATFSSTSSAYDGENPDYDYDVSFSIEGKVISVSGGLGYVGMDCAKFSDFESEYYSNFRMK